MNVEPQQTAIWAALIVTGLTLVIGIRARNKKIATGEVADTPEGQQAFGIAFGMFYMMVFGIAYGIAFWIANR